MSAQLPSLFIHLFIRSFACLETDSVCSPGCSATLRVDRPAGVEFTELLQPFPPKCTPRLAFSPFTSPKSIKDAVPHGPVEFRLSAA